MSEVLQHQTSFAPPRIAIVGTGIAGSSAAYFLRQQLGADATIVAFEQADRVGGRMQRVAFAGAEIETGATLIHSSNAYLSQFMETLGLQRALPHQRNADQPSTMGIWNGQRFAWQSHPQELRSTLSLLARYRSAPLQIRRVAQEMVGRWRRIYDLQRQGQSFATPRELFESLNLYYLTQLSSYDFFARQGISSRFVHEFIDGVSRINYGQSGSIHAFVDLISLTGAGVAGGSLFSVEGGNVQICEGLLRKAQIDVRLATAVAAVTADDAAGKLRYRLTTADDAEEIFDAVVLATPLERTNLQLNEIAEWSPASEARQYQVTHATFVAGNLNPAFFLLPASAHLPETILTPELPALPFSSIGLVGHSPTLSLPIYKVFSRAALDDSLIDLLFTQTAEVLRVVWHAYPVLVPKPAWEPFRLQHGLYYVNAMESAVSTMETEAVASRNVAQLLVSDLAQP